MDKEKIKKLDELRARLLAVDNHLEQLNKIRLSDPDMHLIVAYNKDYTGRYYQVPMIDEGFALKVPIIVHCYIEAMKGLRSSIQLEIDNL